MTSCSLSLINEGYKEISTLNIDGIDHPNWGIGTNKLLTETLTSSTTFKYYPIGTGVGATWGNRYTFCITRQTSNISNFYVIISSTQPLATAGTLNGIMSATNFYYNSSNNNYYVNNVSIGIPALYVYPNINVDGGQVYFRIEPDKKIYSGYSKQTSSLIGTSNFTGQIHVGIVVQQTSGTGTGIYKMSSYTLFDPSPTVNPNPFAGHFVTTFFGTGLGYQAGASSYDGSTRTAIYTGTLNSTLHIQTGSLAYLNNGNNYGFFWGVDVYIKIKLTLNGNNIKIGFGSYPSFGVSRYIVNYDTLDGSCRIGNVVGASLSPGLTDLIFRLDKFTNFYVGSNTTNMTLVGNVYQSMDILQNIYTGTFSPACGFYFNGLITYGNSSNQISIQNLEWGSDLSGFDFLYRNDLIENGVPSATQFKLVNGSLSGTSTITTTRFFFSERIVFYGSSFGTCVSLQTIGIQNITNIYVYVLYDGQLTPSPFTFNGFLASGTKHFYYDCSANIFKRNGVTLSTPFSPSSSLLNLNGKLYVEVKGNNEIYFGNDEANKILITNNTSGLTGADWMMICVWIDTPSGKYAFKRLFPS